MTSTEESPLLTDRLHADVDWARCTLPTEDVYDRFSRGQKRVILTIVSLTGLLPSASCISARFPSRLNPLSISVRQRLLCPVDTSNFQ